MRILSLLLFVGLVSLAVAIYQVKYETRALEKRVAELRLDVQQERDAIAVLRAEWGHLNRPERVERLARKHLGLKPLGARQLISLDQIPARWSEPTSDSNSEPADANEAEGARRPEPGTR